MKNLDQKSREEKLKDLRLELIRKNVAANKNNKGKSKEIKKAIARLLTLNTVQTKPSLEKKK